MSRSQDGAPGATRPLPLAGIRVIEFCHTIMGPSCGLVLADLGADVVKVEPLEGDRTRRLSGFAAGFFAYFNRNKVLQSEYDWSRTSAAIAYDSGQYLVFDTSAEWAAANPAYVALPGGSGTPAWGWITNKPAHPFPGLSGGLATTSLAAWDGANWSVPGHGTDDTVRAFAEGNPGTGDRLGVAGEFTSEVGAGFDPFGAALRQGPWT